MDIEVFILGTGGMMPLPGRGLTSVLVRREGNLFLFDCGEATQIALRRLNLRWKKISHIFISHTHADHVTGLPGILSLSSQVERDEPLHIYGPPKIEFYVEQSLKALDIHINYEIKIHETLNPGMVLQGSGYEIRSIRLLHTKPCFGYALIEQDRPGVFFPEKADELNIPRGPLWSKLQNGSEVNINGEIVRPHQVMGAKRNGRKFVFITDTTMVPELVDFVSDADLMICEGMFTQDLIESAKEKKHLTAGQAGWLAKVASVKRLGLIHYSPRYTHRELQKLLQEAKGEFLNVFLTRELQTLSIKYEEK